MDDATYRRMQMACSCGHVSRNMGEEARHRHNFPHLCKRPKAVKTIPCYAHCGMRFDPVEGCKRHVLIRSDGVEIIVGGTRVTWLLNQGRLVYP